jgi:hypothetical protein
MQVVNPNKKKIVEAANATGVTNLVDQLNNLTQTGINQATGAVNNAVGRRRLLQAVVELAMDDAW